MENTSKQRKPAATSDEPVHASAPQRRGLSSVTHTHTSASSTQPFSTTDEPTRAPAPVPADERVHEQTLTEMRSLGLELRTVLGNLRQYARDQLLAARSPHHELSLAWDPPPPRQLKYGRRLIPAFAVRVSGDCTPCTATLEVGIVEASSGQPLNNVLKGELTARLNGGVACFSSVVLHLAARPSLKRMLALRLVVRATERCRSEAPIRPLVSRTIVVHNRPTMPSRLSAAARLIVDGDAVGEKPRAHRVLASSGRPVASVTRADGAPRAASPPHGDVALVCADESDDEALHDASLFTDVLEMLDDADADADADEASGRVRALYDRLLERTGHVKVWLSLARWENEGGRHALSDEAFERAHAHFRAEGLKVERLAVLEAWAQCLRERARPDDVATLERVQALMPKRVRKKRALVAADGSDGGWEEYYDYIYPDEQAAQPSLKILEMAHKWKRQRGDGERGDEQ
uniref:Uncharacterized protein n=1 Tax=Diacronema lutheri TaxID=2081491 RepID=A0A6T5YPN7_DIALT|mmetsp:Transcript_11640/g.36858  ORF Transcript_11640/g.36858 Transcript_11640/m.36858 type:complete len:463 (+) Transcript_11640:145-1533(+)